jgi:hypothetical protein
MKQVHVLSLLVIAALMIGVSPLALGTEVKAQERENGGDLRSMTSSEQEPEIVSVSVDGYLYSLEEFEQQFGNQPLHWVADPDAEAEGVLIAFTTEENRDSALGIRELGEDEDAAAESLGILNAAVNYPVLYQDINYRGQIVVVRQNIANLGSFNDKASSVQAFHFGIILYEDVNYRGCSLHVQQLKQILALAGHRRCNLLRDWNDAASSVKLVR